MNFTSIIAAARRAKDSRQAVLDELVEAARSEVRAHYEETKKLLPRVKREAELILKELSDLVPIAQDYGWKTSAINRYTTKLSALVGGPASEHFDAPHLPGLFHQLQVGLKAFEELTVGQLLSKDGQPDRTLHNEWVDQTRRLLRAHDGAISSARSYLGQFRQALQDWHNIRESEAGLTEAPPLPAVSVQSPGPRDTVTVEGFSVGGPNG